MENLRRHGERKAIVEADGWDYQTCRCAAVVASAFPAMFRRRNNLSFSHHNEVIALTPGEADALLDWCEDAPKPRSKREVTIIEAKNQTQSTATIIKAINQPRRGRVALIAWSTLASACSRLRGEPHVADHSMISAMVSLRVPLAIALRPPAGRQAR